VSDSAPPDVAAFRELEQLVHHLGEELATFRRRAINAESRLKRLESMSRDVAGVSLERLAEAERENAELKKRLGTATERTRQMLDRVRFLRQQLDQGAER
jgi:hypothetical protein